MSIAERRPAPFGLIPGLKFSGTDRISLFVGRNHFRDPAHARVACIQVVLLVHDPVAGLDELPRPYTHSVTDRAEYLTIPIQLQELAILPARHPWLAVRVKIEGANEVSHLHRFDKLPAAAIDDDTIFLAVA